MLPDNVGVWESEERQGLHMRQPLCESKCVTFTPIPVHMAVHVIVNQHGLSRG